LKLTKKSAQNTENTLKSKKHARSSRRRRCIFFQADNALGGQVDPDVGNSAGPVDLKAIDKGIGG